MSLIFSFLNGNVNLFYLFILEITLLFSTLFLSYAFLRYFRLIPIFKYYQAFFWLSGSLFWLSNFIQGLLALSHNSIAVYFSYFSIICIALQHVIFVTFLLSVLFNYYKFAPLMFFITFFVDALLVFILFIQKNIFYLNQNEWLIQYSINFDFQKLFLYIFLGPLFVLSLILLIKNIYLLIKKEFNIFNKLNLYITFSFLFYLLIFILYYSQFFFAWVNIIILLLLILAPLFSYLLLVDTSSYQDDIINPQNTSNTIITVPLISKFLIGEFIALFIPLLIANLIVLTFYKIITGVEVLTFSSNLLKHLAILDLFILIFALSFNIIMTKKIITRLYLLIKGTKEVKQGNLSYQIEVRGHDEITVLTQSFNEMILNLKKYKEELKNYSLVLEKEIEKQTMELRKKRHEAELLAEQNMTLYKQLQNQTSTIIDNITDFLVAVDHNGKIMNINKILIEKYCAGEDPLGQEISSVPFFKQYKLDKIIEEFKAKSLEKYNFRLNLTKPYYGFLECYLSTIDMEGGKEGVLLLMKDTSPPWGTVLNSQTYQPVNLAVVRLFDNSNNKLLETAVTDENGRFGFFVKPGNYYMSVMKDNFHFPSKNEAGYHGELIQVRTKEEGIIKVNILIDPVDDSRITISDENKVDIPDTRTEVKEESLSSLSASENSSLTNNDEAAKANDSLVATETKQTVLETKAESSTVNTVETNSNNVKNLDKNSKIEEHLPVSQLTPSLTENNITNETVNTENTQSATALSDRALRAKEAKKAIMGNTNPEEKPGQMLKQIKHIIDETKKVQGTENEDDLSVLKTIDEEEKDLEKNNDENQKINE